MKRETFYAVVIVAEDGSVSVTGPFINEYVATLWANDHETEESGWTCHVRPLELPEEAGAYMTTSVHKIKVRFWGLGPRPKTLTYQTAQDVLHSGESCPWHAPTAQPRHPGWFDPDTGVLPSQE